MFTKLLSCLIIIILKKQDCYASYQLQWNIKICLCQGKFRKKNFQMQENKDGCMTIFIIVAMFNFITNRRNWIQDRSISQQMKLVTGQIFNNLLPPSLFCDFIMEKNLLSNFYHKNGCLRHIRIWIENCFISTKRHSRPNLLECELYYLTHALAPVKFYTT